MANQFKKAFGEYVCEGDTISGDIEGFHVVAKIIRDDSGDRPDERDEGFWPSLDPASAGYIGSNDQAEYEKQKKRSQEILDAWLNEEWFYCGVVLSVSKFVSIKGRVQAEVVISDHAASLWGIACNYFNGGNEYLTEVANELLGEALDHARECLKQLAA